jgi:hypothetical protein
LRYLQWDIHPPPILRAGAMALVLQNARDQLADIRLIVDDQDIGCHRVRAASASSLSQATLIRQRVTSHPALSDKASLSVNTRC